MNVLASRRVVLVVMSGLACTSLAVVLVLFVMNGTLRGYGTAIVFGIVYALPLMALQAATEAGLRRWADASRFPFDWIVYAGAKLIIALVSAGIGSSLALLVGLAKGWQELYIPNRMVVVLSLFIACALRFYSTTRNRLEERNRQLELKAEAEARAVRLHEQDLEQAREIQQTLMPRTLPQIRGCQLAGGCQPARVVGGDYYDAICFSESRVAIAVGDVSGKGMAAALLMSNLQAIVRAFAPSGIEPHELCTRANQLIATNVAPGKFITFFYAVVNSARMRIDYCNAGHNPPMLQHRDGTLEFLGEGGPVLGVLPGARYADGMAELRPGDCLVVSTDGITEAMNAQDEEFGEERLAALFKQRSGGAEAYHQQIVNAVTEFSDGNFHDDATVLVMTVQ
jgi:phosphoserine phosphatase RsbU/P